MNEENKSIYGNVKVIKPRVEFPTPTPSHFEQKLQDDNKKLIEWLNSLKGKLVFFK